MIVHCPTDISQISIKRLACRKRTASLHAATFDVLRSSKPFHAVCSWCAARLRITRQNLTLQRKRWRGVHDGACSRSRGLRGWTAKNRPAQMQEIGYHRWLHGQQYTVTLPQDRLPIETVFTRHTLSKPQFWGSIVDAIMRVEQDIDVLRVIVLLQLGRAVVIIVAVTAQRCYLGTRSASCS